MLKRCTKEYTYYAEEKVANQEKLEKLKQQEGVEEGLLRRAEECVAESEVMLPNCAGKIHQALPELQQLLDENAENEELAETEEWSAAKLELDRATQFVETI